MTPMARKSNPVETAYFTILGLALLISWLAVHWILAVVVLMIGGYLWDAWFNPDNDKVKVGGDRERQEEEEAIENEARAIAAKVQTRAQFNALVRRADSAEERFGGPLTEAQYDRLGMKHAVLQEALDLVLEQEFERQYLPDLEFSTPLVQIEWAYKVLPLKEWNQLAENGAFNGLNDTDWESIRGCDEPEDKEPEVGPLLRIKRAAEEPGLSPDERRKKVTRLVRRNAAVWQLDEDGIEEAVEEVLDSAEASPAKPTPPPVPPVAGS